jgi:hypothetical protein
METDDKARRVVYKGKQLMDCHVTSDHPGNIPAAADHFRFVSFSECAGEEG